MSDTLATEVTALVVRAKAPRLSLLLELLPEPERETLLAALGKVPATAFGPALEVAATTLELARQAWRRKR